MFGKNYDDQISSLIDVNNNLVKSSNLNTQAITDVRTRIDDMLDNILHMAKVQSQHKAIINFLINHASFDADSQEDLFKILGQMKQINEDIGEITTSKPTCKNKNGRQTQKKETVKKAKEIKKDA